MESASSSLGSQQTKHNEKENDNGATEIIIITVKEYTKAEAKEALPSVTKIE